MDDLKLPNTDSPEVMQQAVALHLTAELWEQASRDVHPSDWEQAMLELYKRVFVAVSATHGG